MIRCQVHVMDNETNVGQTVGISYQLTRNLSGGSGRDLFSGAAL